MEFCFSVGVDVSKEWLDVAVWTSATREELLTQRIDNTIAGVRGLYEQLSQVLGPVGWTLERSVLLLEHTGLYQEVLTHEWLALGGALSIIPAQRLGEKLGHDVQREKTDLHDARRLAEYGTRFADQLELWRAPREALRTLRYLQTLRERLLKVRMQLEAPLAEMAALELPGQGPALVHALQQPLLEKLEQTIQHTQAHLDQLIEQDEELRQLFKLITSVPGIGPVTAREILITTGGFTRFAPDQAKAYSRFTGVAPRRHESGKSVRKKHRSPKRSGQGLKTLLTMCARSASYHDPEIARYYERKCHEGKHHNVIINAIRNKLILRVFAVVRNQLMYQKNLNLCLQGS